MSFDGAAAFVSLSPSPSRSFFQLLFFLFPPTESCFRRLSSLYVRDRHTSCSLRVWLVRACVCARALACLPACVCLSLCLCMSEYFSGVEAAFMSVPSVENGSVSEGQPLSRCTGLPTLFRRAKCLHLMLDLCYLSMKLLVKTSYASGNR